MNSKASGVQYKHLMSYSMFTFLSVP